VKHKIPDSFVEELRKAVDIVDVVSEYVQLRRAGRSYTGLCPFHNERSPSFSVSSDRQLFHCFGCGAGGTVIRFTMDIEGLSFTESVQILAERANLMLPFELDNTSSSISGQTGNMNQLMSDAHDLAAKYYNYILMNTATGVQALTYLEERGISNQTMIDFQLGYSPNSPDTLIKFLQRRGFETSFLIEAGLGVAVGSTVMDRFRDRVMIPIADARGKVMAFGGRLIHGENGPKYLNSPESPIFHKGKMLFNQHAARKAIRSKKTAVLLEGYMDVVAAWQAGVQHAVASLGTSFTAEQANLLKRYCSRIVIAYDGDRAGIAATERALTIAKEVGLEVRIAPLPNGQDPDDFVRAQGASAFVRLLNHEIVTGVQFLLQQLRANATFHNASGRNDFLRQALDILGEYASPIERESELRRLSSEYNVSLDTLMQEARGRLSVKDDARKERYATRTESRPAVKLPGEVLAGKRILQAMLLDEKAYEYMLQRELDELCQAEQTALLALLYAYRTTHPGSSAHSFLDALDDEELHKYAASLLVEELPNTDDAILDSYLRTIRESQLRKAVLQIETPSAADDTEKAQAYLWRLQQLSDMRNIPH